MKKAFSWFKGFGVATLFWVGFVGWITALAYQEDVKELEKEIGNKKKEK